MQKMNLILIIVVLLTVILVLFYKYSNYFDNKSDQNKDLSNKTFILNSKEFVNGQTLSNAHEYNNFGCSGQNLSPAFDISGVPKDTKSLALTAYDPDANTGSGFWHWVVYNIDPSVTEIKSGLGSEKKHNLNEYGLQAINDFGAIGYDGPCPPKGETHRYIYTLHALNTKLDVEPNTPNPVVRFMINSSTIDTASTLGLYSKK
jgi:Raf kinase inhibitor-like YbhB/YbcL family protein